MQHKLGIGNKHTMLHLIINLMTIFALNVSISVYALDDDTDVVTQCTESYQHVSSDPQRVKVFCSCIVEQMPDSAKLKPIERWIKIHPNEISACRVVLK